MRRLFALLTLAALPVAVPAAPRCDDGGYRPFLNHFLGDAAFSRNRTVWPLKVTKEAPGHPDDRTTTSISAYSEYWRRINSPAEYMEANPGTATSLTKLSRRRMKVMYYIPDGDVLFFMYFEERDRCWYLTWLQDTDQDRY